MLTKDDAFSQKPLYIHAEQLPTLAAYPLNLVCRNAIANHNICRNMAAKRYLRRKAD